jgi:PadR family transcriptional regulator, regulatory protein PadR
MGQTSDRDTIPPGTLEMLVLRTLAAGRELHGFEIAEAIHQSSDGILQVEEGSLYPALQRMLIKDWIKGEWGRTDENRRARYYRLTPAGRRQLEREMETYRRIAYAIERVLQPV